MIPFTVQASNLRTFKEASKSICQRVRFGSEFCMYDLPTEKTLIKAFNIASDAGKDFTYITPRVSDSALDTLVRHFSVLNGLGEMEVVVNDLGVLDTLKKFPNLNPYLGRQLVYIPARCPWPQITEHPASIFVRYKVKQIFYRTALNYNPTIRFYREMGVQAADVDWIPQSFKHYKELVKHGVQLSVHSYLIPVTVTRRCHTARFLQELNPARCSRSCLRSTFRLKQETLGAEFFLGGNVAFRYTEPQQNDLKKLTDIGDIEIVIPAGDVLKAVTKHDLEKGIMKLRGEA
ncbi:MAG: hypothetical protein JSW01_03900 [Candidatus Bathyarchaeota archaeon]|nr:MAG: hypothetical protein JSW01_03900 [Candidatus Bathyarchaeota archaeon]